MTFIGGNAEVKRALFQAVIALAVCACLPARQRVPGMRPICSDAGVDDLRWTPCDRHLLMTVTQSTRRLSSVLSARCFILAPESATQSRSSTPAAASNTLEEFAMEVEVENALLKLLPPECRRCRW